MRGFAALALFSRLVVWCVICRSGVEHEPALDRGKPTECCPGQRSGCVVCFLPQSAG